jgi:AcrR family transcriptional regulator
MNVKRRPPRIRTTRAEAKTRTRAALLAAGARVFAAEGFHRATVEDIAEGAGFTRGAFYANFHDKADLLLTLLDEQSRARLAELGQELEAEPGEFGLTALAGWFAHTFTAASPLDVAVAEFTPIAIREPAHAARIQQRVHEVRDYVTTIVETECSNAGFEIPIPAARFATMIIALVDGIGALHRLDPEAAPPDLLTEALVYLGEGMATQGSSTIDSATDAE